MVRSASYVLGRGHPGDGIRLPDEASIAVLRRDGDHSGDNHHEASSDGEGPHVFPRFLDPSSLSGVWQCDCGWSHWGSRWSS